VDNPTVSIDLSGTGITTTIDTLSVVTDTSWKASGVVETNWQELSFDDSTWPNAVDDGPNMIIHDVSNPPEPGDLIPGTTAKFIWESNTYDNEVFLRKKINIDGPIVSAVLKITVDNNFTSYINGSELPEMAGKYDWTTVDQYDVSEILQSGENVIAIHAKNAGGYVGALAELIIQYNN